MAARKASRGHRKKLTFVGGLRHDRIVTPCVIEGPLNGRSFTAWFSQFLAPAPRRGDIVIADNLGSHKGKSVRAGGPPLAQLRLGADRIQGSRNGTASLPRPAPAMRPFNSGTAEGPPWAPGSA